MRQPSATLTADESAWLKESHGVKVKKSTRSFDVKSLNLKNGDEVGWTIDDLADGEKLHVESADARISLNVTGGVKVKTVKADIVYTGPLPRPASITVRYAVSIVSTTTSTTTEISDPADRPTLLIDTSGPPATGGGEHCRPGPRPRRGTDAYDH